jgi:hypothetical protein
MKGYEEYKGYLTKIAFDDETQSFVMIKVAQPEAFFASKLGIQEQTAEATGQVDKTEEARPSKGRA